MKIEPVTIGLGALDASEAKGNAAEWGSRGADGNAALF
jgi:hypothetical protein